MVSSRAELIDRTWSSDEKNNIRCSSSIEQDVTVLKVLSFRAVLQMLLKRIAAFRSASGGRDGRGVNDGGCLGSVCHD
jgi:hypothetical protein